MTLFNITPRRPRNVPEETPGPEDDVGSPYAAPEPDLGFESEEVGVIPDDDERVVQMPI